MKTREKKVDECEELVLELDVARIIFAEEEEEEEARVVVSMKDITERKQMEEELRESEEHLKEAQRVGHLGSWDLNVVTGDLQWSDECYRIYGFRPQEFVPTYEKFRSIVHPEDIGFVQEQVDAALNNDKHYDVDFRFVRPNGEIGWIYCEGEVIRDVEGKPLRFFGTQIDITDRKQAEQAQMRLVAMLEATPGFVGYADARDAHILYINTAGRKMVGVQAQEDVTQLKIADVHPEWTNKLFRDEIIPTAIRDGLWTGECAFLNRNGHEIPVMMALLAHKSPSGEVERFSTVSIDITKNKQAEEELRTSRLQLRALATRLQQIREEERVMIAREIHDEMGGGLTGLKMDLSWLLRKMGDADSGEARVALMDKIHTSNELIDKMIHVVRRISTDLRPSILDDLGLIAALEWQAQEFTKRTEIPCEFVTSMDYVNLEDETATGVFRIFQEALTNVGRHSRATKVVIVLRESERSLFGDESLVLEIRDNGRGIIEEEILNPESLGLLGMKERVLAFGGDLRISGEPDSGTALILKIPRMQGEPS
jgi:PAS domain S-box-containing protein